MGALSCGVGSEGLLLLSSLLHLYTFEPKGFSLIHRVSFPIMLRIYNIIHIKVP